MDCSITHLGASAPWFDPDWAHVQYPFAIAFTVRNVLWSMCRWRGRGIQTLPSSSSRKEHLVTQMSMSLLVCSKGYK